jgi:hypothetical protein
MDGEDHHTDPGQAALRVLRDQAHRSVAMARARLSLAVCTRAGAARQFPRRDNK